MNPKTRRTGFVCHELYMWHDTGNYAGPMPYGKPVQPDTHAENPETKRRFRNLVEVSGLLDSLRLLRPRMATEGEVLRFHTPEHLANVKAISGDTGGDAGFFTPAGRGSYEIAMLSAGGVLAALEGMMDGEIDNAYALVRPPGHHAIAGEGMGFCIFGNAALAGFHAFEHFGLSRIAYIDWDVHHGNGTQSAFYSDPRALTISVHQDNCFPPIQDMCMKLVRVRVLTTTLIFRFLLAQVWVLMRRFLIKLFSRPSMPINPNSLSCRAVLMQVLTTP